MENIITRIIKNQEENKKNKLPIKFILINLSIIFIYVHCVKLNLQGFCIINVGILELVIFNNIFCGFSSEDMKRFKNGFNTEYNDNHKYNNNSKIYTNFINNIIAPIILLKDEKIFFINDEAKNFIKLKINTNFNNTNIYNYLEEKFYKQRLLKIDTIKNYNINSTSVTYPNEKIIFSNGEVLNVDLRCFVLNLDGEEFVCLSIKNNTVVQENKKLYDKLEKNRTEWRKRAEFYANICHDLKTPINIIYSAIQVMNIAISNKKIEAIEKYIGTIKQNCYNLLRLVNNIVSTNKIESGCCKLNLTNNNIVSLVEDIVTSASTYVENNDMDIIFDTDAEEKIIACDKVMIERVVLNLISNSVKYKKGGKGHIDVNIKDKKERVTISVKDNGIGIPENMQKSVFNRFVQSNKKEYDLTSCSSGIGLALVKSVIDMHEGNIYMKSKENMGTEIIFDLPCKRVKEDDKCNAIYAKNIGQNVKIEFPEIYDSAI
ncbi:HAMP domain-containing histidine kinase [Clostridium botulinum]|nr:HAMP domain-containing histidine kinase [Clostridium botulinum]